MGSPHLEGDRSSGGDASCAVADHTARHGDEPRLVQTGYGLDGQRVRVVPDEDIIVGRPVPRVVGVEALLQVPQRLGHDPGAQVLFGKARNGPEKRILEREIRRAAGRLPHLFPPVEPLVCRLEGPLEGPPRSGPWR